MTRDDALLTQEQLIDLLCQWWRYESQWRPVKGYPPESPSMRGYRTSKQYDDANGAAETDARGQTARMVGHVVSEMPEPERTALQFLARNRATGVVVWVSPRLPKDEAKRAELVARALDLFGMMWG